MKSFSVVAITAIAFCLCCRADGAVVFDFESLSTGSFASVSQTISGMTVTAYAEGGNIVVQDTAAFGAVGFGNRSLIGGGSPLQPIVINFSAPVTSVKIRFGDFNQDSETATMQVYSGANATGLLGASSAFYSATDSIANGVAGTLTFSAASISSIRLTSIGTSSDNSVFWDNLSIEPAASNSVPEPATLTMFSLSALGFAGAALRRRKQVA